MFKNKFLFATFFVVVSLFFLFFPATVKAYDVASLKSDIDYFLGSVGASGYLIWQYSGNRQTSPLASDSYSFWKDDVDVCQALKDESGKWKGKFIGVNMWDIAAHPDQFGDVFPYLQSCGVTMVRIFASSTGSLPPSAVDAAIKAAGASGIQVIVAAEDFPNIVAPANRGNIAEWYTSRALPGSDYQNHLADVVNAIKGESNLYAIELMNEAHCGGDTACVPGYINWANTSAGVVRSLAGVKVSIGQGAGSEGELPTDFAANYTGSNGNMDIASGHHYYDHPEQKPVNVKAAGAVKSTGKSFYIGESGFAGSPGGIGQPGVESEIPCNQTTNSEFHNLRPYPHNPCDKQIHEVTLSCGNDLYTKRGFEVTKGGGDGCTSICDPAEADGSQVCKFQCDNIHTKISVDLGKAELPIAGNTELVPHNENGAGVTDNKLDPTQRVNQYVSWYLNGAAYPPYDEEVRGSNLNSSEYADKVINFAGPLRKLLPSLVQTAQRILQAKNAVMDPIIRHNQAFLCSTAPGIANILPCTSGGAKTRLSDILFGANQYFAQRYLFVAPSSSTEDRKGQAKVQVTQTDQTFGDAHITNIAFKLDNSNDRDSHSLYFAHMQENAELARLLQSTFAGIGQIGYSSVDSDGKYFPTKPHCEVVDSRINPGDRLYGNYDNPKSNEKQISGDITYDASFTCKFDPPKPCPSGQDCTQRCKKDAYAGISVFTKTPKIQEIWERLVEGPASVFKRFFPKVGADAPLTEIKDLPTLANASYASSTTGVEALAGDPTKGKSGSTAQLVIPYLGGVQEYFLRGIQKALRPQGFDREALAGQASPPPPSPQCKIGTGTNTHQVLNAPTSVISDGTIALALKVAKVTCTPAELLIGIMAKESRGLANDNTPYTGDPVEIGTRNCAGTGNNCGAFSFNDIDIQAQYQHRPDQMNKCLTSIGLQSGETDQRKLGVSLCAAGVEFWSGAFCAKESFCDGFEHSLSSLTRGQQENAALEFHAKDCDPIAQGGNSDSDGAWKYYDQFIQIYAPDVQKIRAQCQP